MVSLEFSLVAISYSKLTWAHNHLVSKITFFFWLLWTVTFIESLMKYIMFYHRSLNMCCCSYTTYDVAHTLTIALIECKCTSDWLLCMPCYSCFPNFTCAFITRWRTFTTSGPFLIKMSMKWKIKFQTNCIIWKNFWHYKH